MHSYVHRFIREICTYTEVHIDMYMHKDTFVKMRTHAYLHICTQRLYIHRGAFIHIHAYRHTQRVVCLHTCTNRYAQVFTDAHTCTGSCSFIHVLRRKGIHIHTQSHLQVIQLYAPHESKHTCGNVCTHRYAYAHTETHMYIPCTLVYTYQGFTDA